MKRLQYHRTLFKGKDNNLATIGSVKNVEDQTNLVFEEIDEALQDIEKESQRLDAMDTYICRRIDRLANALLAHHALPWWKRLFVRPQWTPDEKA
jgi:hypothetical protein